MMRNQKYANEADALKGLADEISNGEVTVESLIEFLRTFHRDTRVFGLDYSRIRKSTHVMVETSENGEHYVISESELYL